MATEIRLVRRNWGYGMTPNNENYLILRQSPNVNLPGGLGGIFLRKIFNFRSSEIAGNSYSSIYFQERLTKT